ncbi:hypothetical protein AB0I53_48170 [Saccharopolyspora sp. NPDC050389]|uniref:hypothetical protein n=1 Tax=Saccharopolyspora sp. NPDC050389 TaxID=3155516 RepID=UPI00340A80D4
MPARRFYRGWEIDPAAEIDERDRKGTDEHTEAVFDESGQPVRIAFYRGKKPVHFEYRTAELGRARNEHAGKHAKVPFCVVLPNSVTAGRAHFWGELTYFFPSGRGEPANHKVSLFTPGGRRHMTITRGERDEVQEIEKWRYAPDGEPAVIFQYDGDGDVIDIFDVVEGGSTPLEEAMQGTDDPDFFRHGLALPAGLAGRAPPATAELLAGGQT